MATEKDFRVKSSIVAPTSLQVGSATITSSGSDVIFPAGIQSSGVGVPQITSATSVTITAPDGVSLNGNDLATESYVTNQLGSYVTSSALTSSLSGYVTTSTIANYLTISSFNSQIAGYTTTVDLNNALALKANTSSLASVATTGNYNDLNNTPNLASYATQTYVDNAVAAIPTELLVTKRDTTQAAIAIANGTLDILNRSGSTISVTVS